MSEPVWIRDDVVLAIHRRQLAEHGGPEGIRDAGLLESALARPRNFFAYTGSDPNLAALAASYAFGILRNHPFVDGNKRIALMAALAFLGLNDHRLDADPDKLFRLVLGVAAGDTSKADVAVFIEAHLRAL